jgi:adenine-specific DNA-methyltransferase
MTPATIASFMAGIFIGPMPAQVRLLDAGAGQGALTTAFINRWGRDMTGNLEAHAYELDEVIAQTLQENLLALVKNDCVTTRLIIGDFIETAATMLRFDRGPRYTHAILNPPYKKISSTSRHRNLLRMVNLETVNLYSGFVGLALRLLKPGGQLVAIIPRSFCNGPYYKPFRALLLRHAAIRQIHLFLSRNKAFSADDVLQENVIIFLERDKVQTDVNISTSTDATFADYQENTHSFEDIVSCDDSEVFIHIPVEDVGDEFEATDNFRFSLNEIGVNVSTGPVVDFRMRDWLCHMPEIGTIPLLYPGHFTSTGLKWPIPKMKKPNAIRRTAETIRWLLPNGFYTVVRRFSAKEERRRLVSGVVDPNQLPGEVIGFENHLNVFHQGRRPLPEFLARGLSMFLNSTAADRFFRRFNGHTQVNATDLKLMRYPSREALTQLGEWAKANPNQTQEAIDQKIEDSAMTHDYVRDARDILIQLGFPSAQLNARSALVLLAVLDMNPNRKWQDASSPLVGITPVMDWIAMHYDKKYKPNTRETIRRQTMHQFVDAGLVLKNPDEPTRPTNSPAAVYQVSPEALTLIHTYRSPEWRAQLTAYISEQQGLAARYARERDLQRVPVRLVDGQGNSLGPALMGAIDRSRASTSQRVDGTARRHTPPR